MQQEHMVTLPIMPEVSAIIGMIKHDDTDKVWNKLGEFGVVRNSVYDINVSRFNNPGYPVIPPPGPDPDEEEGNYLSVQINVNPWTWYSQEEEF